MKYVGKGLFELEIGDWSAIITWPSHNYCGVEEWETPIFMAEVSRWLVRRKASDHVRLIAIKDSHHRFISITDENLALEFKIRWCREYPENWNHTHIWSYCNEAGA